jgi:hypothetical protein
MIYRFLILVFFISATAYAIDPLSPQFFPSIDQNPAHYSTSFGTITVTDSLYKVFQSSVAPGNIHWAIVYSMQNEIQSFQVHVSPSVNISSLTVTMSSLSNAQTGTVISTNSTDIVVYREFYTNVSTPTSFSTMTYYGGTRAMMPNFLIPTVDPYYHQTTNAFPVFVPSTGTQSAWIDVHVPTSAPSGYYSGNVYVSSGNVVISTMPVVWAVWAWMMPSSATLRSMNAGTDYNSMCNFVYSGFSNCTTYPGALGNADFANTLIGIDANVQLLDNRFGAAGGNNVFPSAGSFATFVSTMGPLLNGTQANRSTILPGAALTGFFIDDSFTPSVYQNWASSFTAQGWMPRLANYLCDEPPGGCSFAQIISSGNASRTYSTPIIPNLVTTDLATAQTNNAAGQIDWITPTIEHLDPTTGDLRSTYNAYLATSSGPVRQIGAYEDCLSAGLSTNCGNGVIGDAQASYSNRHVDGLPVANRAFETWAFLDKLNYELYFAIDYCVDHNCATPANPYQSVYAFGANGDGTLIAPSSAPYVTTSGGTPIWIPTMMLKYTRDGMQDYEYENYLTQKGKGSLVQTQIASWMTNAYTFNSSPAGLEAARMAMGTAIHQLTYPPYTEVQSGQIQIKGKVTMQ